MKKVIASMGAVAVAMAMATTAFASQTADRGGRNTNTSNTTVSTTVSVSNEAYVENVVGASANTGYNTVSSNHGDV